MIGCSIVNVLPRHITLNLGRCLILLHKVIAPLPKEASNLYSLNSTPNLILSLGMAVQVAQPAPNVAETMPKIREDTLTVLFDNTSVPGPNVESVFLGRMS
jgi:hypothetical protein